MKLSQENKNILIMSIGFALIYLGFRSCQSFSVTVLGSLGAYSMGISYFVYSIANFFVPTILLIFPDESLAMKITAFEYPIYLFTFVYVIPALCLTWGAIHGITSALFWGAQGVYLAKNCTNENRGKMTGRFWTIYMFGAVLGNICSYIILEYFGIGGGSSGWNGTTSLLFLFAGMIGLIGCFVFLELPSIQTINNSSSSKLTTSVILNNNDNNHINTLNTSLIIGNNSEINDNKMNIMINIKANYYLIKEKFVSVFIYMIKKPIYYLIPYFINLGFANIWIISMFNRQVQNTSSIGIYMAIYSLVEVLISYPQGYLSDKYGTQKIVYFSFLSEAIAIIFALISNSNQQFLILVYILFAISDTIYQTQAFTIIGNNFSLEDQSTLISIFRMLQSLFGGICYFMSPLFLQENRSYANNTSFIWECVIAFVFLLIAFLCYILFEKHKNDVTIKSILETI